MPELPEVETIKTGLQSIVGKKITNVIVRQPKLRWPIPRNFKKLLFNQKIHNISRRAKYLLLQLDNGTLLIHLGMSGKLNLITRSAAQKHDHVDLELTNGKILRYNDTRRFGSMHWTTEKPEQHFLLQHLGPEPLDPKCNGTYLLQQAKKIKSPIKQFIMNAKHIVGVGNIYANEALFAAKILPSRSACSVTKAEFTKLSASIKKILDKAIKAGGTTIRDYANASGDMGYFVQQLKVYGRGGEPCISCQQPLQEDRLGQRTTVYCQECQV